MSKVNIKSNIPNFITLSKLFLGFVSIVLLALSLASDDINLKIACYLIFIAAFLDTLDGKAARKLKITSDFGSVDQMKNDLFVLNTYQLFFFLNLQLVFNPLIRLAPSSAARLLMKASITSLLHMPI